MSLAELLPDVRALSPDDKVRLMHLLAEDLSAADPAAQFVPGEVYPVWSPYNAYEAAEVLQRMLDAERAKP